ncbi:MAG: hypothetical protein QOH32_2270 [Bradyrhizobium sp.]|jgi:MYXO-CTERM domain-containing protein|nr:hypothetical protein [Bradyrhizobium sp.]
MRTILICATCFVVAGCTPEQWRLRNALRADIAANPQTAAIVIAVLALLVLGLLWALSRRRPARPVERQSFPGWLAGIQGGAPEVVELQAYAGAVHWTSNDINALRQTIENDPLISQAEKVRRASTLGLLYERWQRDSSAQGGQVWTQLMYYLFQNGLGIFLSFFAVAVFLVLAVGMSNSSFFSSLAQVDQARGLITFLVAICAVAVILLTAINIFWGNNAAFNERVTAAKELVTLVVGVLGTILGFYFGSATSDRVLQVNFEKPGSYSVVAGGSTVPVTATAKNGAAPFNFDLLVLDAQGNLISKNADNKQADKAFITQEIKAPATPGSYSIVLLLRDSKGQQTRSSVDIVVMTAPQNPPERPPGASK